MTVKILMDAPLAPVRFEIFALVAAGFLSVSCSAKTQAPPSTDDFSTVSTLKKTPDEVRASRPPNILVIMADDLGYSDLGAYGGEIQTPVLDGLAADGLRFTNFYVAPACSPTRSMFLSGVDNHVAGIGNMEFNIQPEQRGHPGYEGYLNERVVSFASLLSDAGYQTYMVGKWHLGLEIEHGPENRGFQYSFVLPKGSADHFDQRVVPGKDPASGALISYRQNGEEVRLPDRFYSSQMFTDRLISLMAENLDPDKPFFAFASYTAPHWPLQAPDAYIRKYEGVYENGYEEIRAKRLARMKSMGLVQENTAPDRGLDLWPKWSELTEKQKALEVRRMQVYAGMVDALDENIGRLLGYLEEIGELENTYIFVLSDNGAEGNDHSVIGSYASWLQAYRDNSVGNIGNPTSFDSYGPGWGQVSSTPFRLFKGFTTEGGIRSPLIVIEPRATGGGRISNDVISVTDLAPTILDIAQVKPPDGLYRGREVASFIGSSFLSRIQGNQQKEDMGSDYLGFELFGRKGLRQGEWKLVWSNAPYGKDGWELYNLNDDPAEQNDLAGERPDMVERLAALWDGYAQENGVVWLENDPVSYTNENRHYED